jgi:predicted nucleic acid-binding protein
MMVKENSGQTILAPKTIKQRAEQLKQQRIKAVDALHIATAEAANSNYFLTCDKRIIKSTDKE